MLLVKVSNFSSISNGSIFQKITQCLLCWERDDSHSKLRKRDIPGVLKTPSSISLSRENSFHCQCTQFVVIPPPHHEDPTKHSFATGDTKQRWRNLSMVNGSWSRTRTDDTLCIFPFLASMGKSLKEKWIHVEFTLHQALYQRDTTSHPCSWEQRLQSTRLARIQVFVTTRESSKCPSS